MKGKKLSMISELIEVRDEKMNCQGLTKNYVCICIDYLCTIRDIFNSFYLFIYLID